MTQYRRSWTKDQKRELVAEARRRFAAGERMSAIVEAPDVLEGSLRLWLRQFPETALQRVRIIDSVPATAGVVVVAPDGFRFEGLDLISAAELWRRLR